VLTAVDCAVTVLLKVLPVLAIVEAVESIVERPAPIESNLPSHVLAKIFTSFIRKNAIKKDCLSLDIALIYFNYIFIKKELN
jgi:hypothetical protein